MKLQTNKAMSVWLRLVHLVTGTQQQNLQSVIFVSSRFDPPIRPAQH